MRFPLESAHGGAEVQTLSLMRGLRDRGHDVAFLGSCPVLLSLCRDAGIAATELEIGQPPVSKKLAVSFLWRQWKMRKTLIDALEHAGEPDAIVMLSMSEKLLLTEHAEERGARVLWVEHDRIGRWLAWNPWRPMLRKASRHATTVCVSELSRSICIGLGWPANRTVAIPNGIDADRFPVQKRAASPGMLRIGCVARLTRDKGVDVLIRAVKDVPGTTLTIIGAGPRARHLQKMIMETGCAPRITLRAREENLGDFYQQIDLLVLPSREHDPFGLVAAEAMAVGTPVIVTDACGIAGYLQKNEAIVTRANSVRALKRAIEQCMDPAMRERMAAKGKEVARGRFSLDAMVNAYDQLLARGN